MKKLFIGALALLVLAGCSSNPQPPSTPTVIPTQAPPSLTLPASVSPAPSSVVTLGPTPSFRPMITPTPGEASPVAVVNVIAPTATAKPNCVTARKGDTLYIILANNGYDTSVLPAFRALNNMPPDSSIISEGGTYCLPIRTMTPTPEGYEKTRASMEGVLPTRGAITYIYHPIKKGDTTLLLELLYGVPLGVICQLNPLPDGLNCGGCKLDAPLGQAGCRVLLSVGMKIRLPGPPPSATVTPTLTGNETATATLAYTAPRVLAPRNGDSISGQVRLQWLPPGGILAPDEVYLILMSEAVPGAQARNFQKTTQDVSYLLTPEDLPREPGPHTIYWQVGVARLGPDGVAIVLGEKTPPISFTWTR